MTAYRDLPKLSETAWGYMLDTDKRYGDKEFGITGNAWKAPIRNGLIDRDGYSWKITPAGHQAVRALLDMAGDPAARIPVAVRRTLASYVPDKLLHDPDSLTAFTAFIESENPGSELIETYAKDANPLYRGAAARKVDIGRLEELFSKETAPAVLDDLESRCNGWILDHADIIAEHGGTSSLLLLANMKDLPAGLLHLLASSGKIDGTLYDVHGQHGVYNSGSTLMTDEDEAMVVRRGDPDVVSRYMRCFNKEVLPDEVIDGWMRDGSPELVNAMLGYSNGSRPEPVAFLAGERMRILVERNEPKIDFMLAGHPELLTDGMIDTVLERADGLTADRLFFMAEDRRWTDYELGLLAAKCAPESHFRYAVQRIAKLVRGLAVNPAGDVVAVLVARELAA